MGDKQIKDEKPIMTDVDGDRSNAKANSGQEGKKSWLKRFASIFGLASQGQGGGAPGSGVGGGGGF